MVLTAGSTGDVEPFAALAARLAGRGHEVTLAADAGFARLAAGDSVEFAPIRADFQSLLPTPERKRPSRRNDVFRVIRDKHEDRWTVGQAARPRTDRCPPEVAGGSTPRGEAPDPARGGSGGPDADAHA
jgi:hypothetical protein